QRRRRARESMLNGSPKAATRLEPLVLTLADESARQASPGGAAGLRLEVVCFLMDDHRTADDAVLARTQAQPLHLDLGDRRASAVGGQVAEVTSMMGCGLRSSML